MRPQKRNLLTITINKSANDVFAFVLDPNNTPTAQAEVSELPVREGGIWNGYTITSFEKNKSFTIKMKDGNYHAQYTVTPISENETSLEYLEWVIRGVLDKPFTQDVLTKLKTIMESP